MEFAAGGSAEQRLKGAYLLRPGEAQGAPLALFSDAETVAIGYALASALAHIHEEGAYHFDVKPGNVLFRVAARTIAGARSAALADFGSSRVARVFGKTSTKGAFAGTEAFAAPEMHLKLGGKDKADVWSLGATLLALLTGAEVGTEDAVIASWTQALMRGDADWDRTGGGRGEEDRGVYHVHHPPPPAAGYFASGAAFDAAGRAAWDAAPPPLRDLITRCLALRPEARPTAAELLAEPLLAAEAAEVAAEAERRRVEEAVSAPLKRQVQGLQERLAGQTRIQSGLQERLTGQIRMQVGLQERVTDLEAQLAAEREVAAKAATGLEQRLAAAMHDAAAAARDAAVLRQQLDAAAASLKRQSAAHAAEVVELKVRG
jgi:serine/threonine protein kinase